MALMHVGFFSQVLQINVSMDVILPETPCPRACGKWHALYLLHGMSDDHTIWQRRTSIERYADGRGLAVVMPTTQRGFYTDMKHGPKYFTFISEELPEVCERMFPISSAREDRFAAGLSMGGYGAFKLGLRLPERYAAVASLSGVLDIAARVTTAHANSPEFSDIFGAPEELVGSDNDLCALAERLIAEKASPLPRFFIACGTEDVLYQDNQSFMARFGKALDIDYREGPGGHEWGFWDKYIRDVLDWLPIREG